MKRGLGGGGVLEGGPAGKFVGTGAGEGFVAEVVFVIETANEVEGVLLDFPVVETTLTPIGEVLFGDGRAVEMF